MFCGSKAQVLKECAPRNGVFVINPEIAFFRTDIVDYISPYFFLQWKCLSGKLPFAALGWIAAHTKALGLACVSAPGRSHEDTCSLCGISS